MSVPNQTPYNIYTANGLTTVFAYQFMIMNAGDIEVSINGTPQTSGYTVQGAGQTGGGQVVFMTPPANGSVVMLLRKLVIKRDTDYQDNGDLLAETINADFDRLWLAMQQAFLSDSLSLKRPLLGGPYNAGGLKIVSL
ncbi:TPA: phage tail fiber protein, partial [Klebsiella pneumoniae]